MAVQLRAVVEQDCAFLAEWASHPEITRNTLGRRFPTQELLVLNWIQSSNTGEFPSRVAFIIEDLEPSGLVQLDQIDWVSKTAWLGIWLIPASRNMGFGSAALREILLKASDELNLRQVRLLVRSDNVIAKTVYLNAGFEEEGELVRAEFREGKYVNLLILRSELKA